MVTGGVLSGLFAGIGTIVAVAGGVILGSLIMYYLLKDGTRLRRSVVTGVSPGYREELDAFIGSACRILRDYGSGRTVMSAIVSAVVGVAALLMGLPLVFTIFVVNFVGGYIPYIGAFLGGGLAVVIAVGEGGLALGALMLLIVLASNLVLENFVEPKVMGRTLDIHPLVVLVVTALGGLLGGIVGLILAVPAWVIAGDAIKRLRSQGVVQRAAKVAQPDRQGPPRLTQELPRVPEGAEGEAGMARDGRGGYERSRRWPCCSRCTTCCRSTVAELTSRPVAKLALGLGVFVGVMTWHVRLIGKSENPALRALEGLFLGLPLFLLLFAATYFTMSRGRSELHVGALADGLAVLHGHDLLDRGLRRHQRPDRAGPTRGGGPDDARPGHPRRRRADHPRGGGAQPQPAGRGPRRARSERIRLRGIHHSCVMTATSCSADDRRTRRSTSRPVQPTEVTTEPCHRRPCSPRWPATSGPGGPAMSSPGSRSGPCSCRRRSPTPRSRGCRRSSVSTRRPLRCSSTPRSARRSTSSSVRWRRPRRCRQRPWQTSRGEPAPTPSR